jgi:hypothetical protein
MGTDNIPEAELMLSLPIEDWKWLLWTVEEEGDHRTAELKLSLRAQLERQLAAVAKQKESRTQTAIDG